MTDLPSPSVEGGEPTRRPLSENDQWELLTEARQALLDIPATLTAPNPQAALSAAIGAIDYRLNLITPRARASEQAAPPLDVERLARAIWNDAYSDLDDDFIQDWERDLSHSFEVYDSPNEWAARIAAEYARLSHPEQTPGE